MDGCAKLNWTISFVQSQDLTFKVKEWERIVIFLFVLKTIWEPWKCMDQRCVSLMIVEALIPICWNLGLVDAHAHK